MDKKDKQLKAIIGLMCGSKVKLAEVFQDETLVEEEPASLSFSEMNYDELRENLEGVLQERTVVLDAVKGVYDGAILADMLKGGEYEDKLYLSIAKVKSYEVHKEDLYTMKQLLKAYNTKTYNTFFRSNQKDNYCSYVGYVEKNRKKIYVKKCGQEAFYKATKKLLETIKKNEIYTEQAQMFIDKIEAGNFMPVQVTKANGVLPYQVNLIELKTILDRAAIHHPFLKSKGVDSITISDKLIQLLTFRVPYYIGPLNTYHGKNAWLIGK